MTMNDRKAVARELLIESCRQYGVPVPPGHMLLAPFSDEAMPWLVALRAIEAALSPPLTAEIEGVVGKLEAVLAAATKGPWTGGDTLHIRSPEGTEIAFVALFRGQDECEAFANAALIAAAKTEIPALLALLTRQQAEIDRRAGEREAVIEQCAKVAEARGEQYREPVQSDYDRRDGCYDAAAAIRALRSQSNPHDGRREGTNA